MENRNELTGFEQRGYTGHMSEGGVDVLEKQRDDAIKARAEVNQEDLRATAEAKLKEKEKEWKERREARLEGGPGAIQEAGAPPELPEIVLRKETKLDKFGWSEDEVLKTKRLLQEMLHIRESSAENAIELLIANGKKAGEVLAHLEDSSAREKYDKLKNDVRISYEDRMTSEESEKYAKLAFLQKNLGINNESTRKNDYLKRFVLDDDFRQELKRDFDSENPGNLYELAWNISFQEPVEFGVNGSYPVLELRIDKDKNGETTGRYCVNKANFVRWVRLWINKSQDKDEDAVTNYFGDVKLSKQLRPVTLGEILDDYTRYFTDEEGGHYGDLFFQTLLEPWMMQTIKNYDVEYKKVMAQEKALPEKLADLYHYSKLTKKTMGKSMWYYMSTLAVDFDGTDGDSTLGGAANAMFLAYYNMSDFEELQRTLGKDSKFFKRSTMKKAMEEVIVAKAGAEGTVPSKAPEEKSAHLQSFMGSDNMKTFEKAFTDKQGNACEDVQDPKAFIELVNYQSNQWANHNLVDVVDHALQDSVSDIYDFTSQASNPKKDPEGKLLIDKESKKVAKLIAKSMIRFTGAGAKNDIKGNGFDVISKFINTEVYRRKMATPERGNSAGNPYTVPFFKGMMVDLVTGLRVAEAYTTKGINGEKTKERQKTPLEVMMELNEVGLLKGREIASLRNRINEISSLTQRIDHPETYEDERKRLQARLDQLNKTQTEGYKQLAGQLEFKTLAMANYAANHVARAQKMYDQVMSAKEISFDKFTSFDVFHGVTFDRAEFQKQVQDELLKPLRYQFSTYGDLNFNMPVRRSEFVERKDGKDVTRYRTMPLGEALFGYDMLNIPKFHKREKIIGRDGKVKKNKDGTDMEGRVIKNGGRNVIDYDKVQKDQTEVWKQWVLIKLGADLWTHIDTHSTDPAYGIKHYKNILSALDNIPGGILGDDTALRKVQVNETFFTKEQMKRLKKMSATTNFKLYRRAILDDLFGGRKDKPSYWGDSFSLFVGAIFKGY